MLMQAKERAAKVSSIRLRMSEWMVSFKNRYMDQSKRLIKRHIRLEICAVDSVEFHKEPNDHKFNTVTVIMRDRAKRLDPSKSYYRAKLPVLQNFMGGNHLGENWTPRKGDLVYVFFYKEREGIVLGNAWSWAEYPTCRPTEYDQAAKGGQWMEPYQHPETGDFLKQPYPSGKKPYCFRWFHGPVTGHTGPGRDLCWMFDYCRMGDQTPSCKDCKTIDSLQRLKNQYFKFYSEETESRRAYPYRAEFHAHCGSFWMFESKDRPTDEYLSEVYTEGEGYWTLQGAKIENGIEVLLGHMRHSPDGSLEGHSATSNNDDIGSKYKVYGPDSAVADQHGLIAWEVLNLEKKCMVRGYKDGAVRLRSSLDPTGLVGRAEVFLGADGHCWLWNGVDNAGIEFFSGGVATVTSPSEINLNAPLIKQNGVQIHPSASRWRE
jgi:hypothetical protein